MSFVGFGKAMSYLVKGAEVIGAVGTLYDLFDAPRRSREEVRMIEQRVDKEVDYFMERKIEPYIDAVVDKKLILHDRELMENLNSRLDAVIAAQKMREKKGTEDGQKSS